MLLSETDKAIPITWEVYKLLPVELVKEQQCVHCGIIFKECENIGLHMCHIHPGIQILRQGSIGTDAFHSCCGQPVTILSKQRGCLEWDHNAYLLSESDAEMRLSQIQAVSTIIIPHLLLRFVTQPLQSSVAYNSRRPNNCGARRFTLYLPVLEYVSRRNSELSICHSPQINNWLFEETCARVKLQPNPGIKEFDLHVEAQTLWQEGKDSPFFSRFIVQSNSSEQQIEKRCDALWKFRFSNNNNGEEESEEDDCFQEVSFVIITRINNRLEIRQARK